MRSPRLANGTLSEAIERATRVVEILKLRDALSRTSSRAEAAELLGIAPRTLAAKLKELGMGRAEENSPPDEVS